MPLGHVGPVAIRVHATFVVLLVLVAVAAGSPGAALGAIGWLVALFACVVVHELAHAAMARSKGIAVHEIDLLPIGGVSRLERIPEAWRDEAAIAVVGPLASLGLAMLLFAVGLPLGWEAVIGMAWINVVLAGFNLLPVFPLDGGRVLRALLERRRDRLRATHLAGVVSRVLAGVMAGIGLLVDPWLVVIALFILFAGTVEEAAVLVHTALGPLSAGEIAVPAPVTLPAGVAAGPAAHEAALHPQPAYPVTDAIGDRVGVVTPEALRQATPDTPVGQLASARVVEADHSVEDLVDLGAGVGAAVVGDEGFVGVLSGAVVQDALRRRVASLEARRSD
jgi:Zn-dependent protease